MSRSVAKALSQNDTSLTGDGYSGVVMQSPVFLRYSARVPSALAEVVVVPTTAVLVVKMWLLAAAVQELAMPEGLES